MSNRHPEIFTLMLMLTLKFNLTDMGITNILTPLLPYLRPFVALSRSNSVSRHPLSLRPIHFSAQLVHKICTAHILHNIYVRQLLTQVPQVMVSDRVQTREVARIGLSFILSSGCNHMFTNRSCIITVMFISNIQSAPGGRKHSALESTTKVNDASFRAVSTMCTT